MDPYDRRSPPPREIRSTSDEEATLRPSRWELRDFAGGWLLLSAAFTVLLVGGADGLPHAVATEPDHVVTMAVVSLVTVGGGFVVHEYAHKATAVSLGHPAAFRANYGLLAVGCVTALAGFFLAAPGAVHHRRHIPSRDRGLVAVAGPLANVALGVLLVVPIVGALFSSGTTLFTVGGEGVDAGHLLLLTGLYGTAVNFALAGFNMVPLGPLDGKKVYLWNGWVYLATAVPCLLLGLAGVLLLVWLSV